MKWPWNSGAADTSYCDDCAEPCYVSCRAQVREREVHDFASWAPPRIV